MKLAIIGSRIYNNYEEFTKLLKEHINDKMPEQIISGGAIGVDTMAAKFAEENKIDMVIYKPDYNKYGKRAPLIRNHSIIDTCDSVIAFVSKKITYKWYPVCHNIRIINIEASGDF